MPPSSRHSHNLGQIIEYIPGTCPAQAQALSSRSWLRNQLQIAMDDAGGIAKFWLYMVSPSSVLTYIADRLYLAAYIHPPTHETLFPYPEQPVSPRKRAQRAAEGTVTPVPGNRPPPCYFSVDDTLLYNAFHHDFGPLHIGHLYRFAIQFHEILGAKENKDRPIVFWSAADPRSEYSVLCEVTVRGICELTGALQVERMPLACSRATWC